VEPRWYMVGHGNIILVIQKLGERNYKVVAFVILK
jgi:hypothetical protein